MAPHKDSTMNKTKEVSKLKLRPRRLNYYDIDKQRTRSRLFNPVEIDAANNIFDSVEDILYDYVIENKWISICNPGRS